MRCPVCKADNVQGPACRRCKADLALLFAVEARRAWELAAARADLAAGRWQEAHTHAARADGLRRDEESLRLRAAAAVLGRDFAEAWRCYRARAASRGG